MHAAQLMPDLRPDAILGAIDGYDGTIVDLDRSLTVDPAQFALGCQQLTCRFRQLGLCAGDRVVVAVGNGPLFIATLAAVLENGGSPLLVHALTPAAELKRTALRFGARFLIADSCAEQLTILSVTQREHDWGAFVWAELDESDPAFQHYPVLPGVPLHPTSGTTGRPKVAVRPAACAIAEAEHYIETIGIERGDVILPVSPMSHAYAYGMGVMVPLLSGANIFTMRKFQPKLVFEAFAGHGVTIFPAVPAMLDVLLFGAGDRLKNSPQQVFSAGAPLPDRVAQNYERLSGVAVRPLYGTTESGGVSVGVSHEDVGIVGCVGRAMNGVDVEARTADPLLETGGLPAGLGSVCVRSSSMMAGYLSPEGIDSSAIVDGWFRTGDLGMVDARGAIHLKGRETEVINVAGMKVVPSEVEEVVAAMPDVAEVKVYAGGSRSGSQIVRAAIVPEASPLEGGDAKGVVERVRSHCKEHLIYYKCPSIIVVLDVLPKTPSGKVILNQLPQ